MPREENKTNTSDASRPSLRGDAARNIRRVLDAGRAVFRENPQASADDVARAAGLGVATLYRRFPTRDDLLRGVVMDIFETDMAPAMARAEREPDPREGVRIAFEAGLSSASQSGFSFPAGITLEIIQSTFLDPLNRMICRAQKQGLLRADIDPEKDTFRILCMLLAVVPTFRQDSEGWRRYLTLVLESLTLTPAEPLPPAEAVVDPFRRGR
ncbi:TetR/AcrR family transcriptional regulator [Streptomyces sp. NPDC002680]|uniref:TetR/AcrR family transcriptional regulator n=1 Tax=Streptomyces sp. NPDC002680 TaxID=3364659 RepID=UPI003696019D